ncbi:hypothetical protein [Nonomuraea glycinis]|uniref:hypothetical protein n=1 Tax=Nonomuraea glycinis TaxID=2047744 RepID=UPI002E0E5BD0|nr:hypothetical protein OHA68_43360 [Nonomuraea glycinis]
MDQEKQKGGAGGTIPERRPNDQKAANSKATVARRINRRHVTGQLPIVHSATAYPPAWGMVTVLIVLDDECECGYFHAHRVKVPAPALLRRTARCGTKYELALHGPKAKRRGRAA